MLARVEAAAETYALARNVLKGRMEALRRALDDSTRAMLPQIKAAAKTAEAARARLEGEIHTAAEDFHRPRTRTFAGVKVGFRTGRQVVDWGTDDEVIAAIRKHYPFAFARLVKVTEKPVSAALAALPEPERHLLGVGVVPGSDQVVIRPADAGMDKEVETLLADAARVEGGAPCD